MGFLLKSGLFVLLAVAAGVCAVSVPLGDRTAAEHVRATLEPLYPAKAPVKPVKTARIREERTRAPTKKKPPEGPTDDERAALDRLIRTKVR